MGYETRLYVVEPYGFTINPNFQSGSLLASVELCKCYESNVGELIRETREAQKDDKPFALWAFNPDRQQEGVEHLRELAEAGEYNNLSSEELKKLSNDLEDGEITKDCYGDRLPGMKIRDVVRALQEDVQTDNYRRFRWALALLKEIAADVPHAIVVAYGH